jgi:hypothetical protein
MSLKSGEVGRPPVNWDYGYLELAAVRASINARRSRAYRHVYGQTSDCPPCRTCEAADSFRHPARDSGVGGARRVGELGERLRRPAGEPPVAGGAPDDEARGLEFLQRVGHRGTLRRNELREELVGEA